MMDVEFHYVSNITLDNSVNININNPCIKTNS